MNYFFGVLMMMVAMVYGIMAIVYIVTSLGELFIFRKAGVPGWQAFIPILNTYRLCEIAKTKDFFVWMMILPIASFMMSSMAEHLELGLLEGIISFASFIIQMVLTAVVYKRLSEAFGYDGWGWVILMILLSPIVFLIMGLNDSKYEAPFDELTLKDYIQQFNK